MRLKSHVRYDNTRPAWATIAHAIRESVQERRIVSLIYSDGIAELLRREAEGESDTGEVLEIWGATINGDEWRIHLERKEKGK